MYPKHTNTNICMWFVQCFLIKHIPLKLAITATDHPHRRANSMWPWTGGHKKLGRRQKCFDILETPGWRMRICHLPVAETCASCANLPILNGGGLPNPPGSARRPQEIRKRPRNRSFFGTESLLWTFCTAGPLARVKLWVHCGAAPSRWSV